MDTVNKLEKTVAGWYSSLPHLPKAGQQWLAKNVWWLLLIGVVISVMGVFTVLGATFFASALLTAAGGVAGAALGGLAMLWVVVWLAFAVVVLVLQAMAISPLKAMKKRGWTLLFIVMLLQVVMHVASLLAYGNFMGFIWDVLIVGVSAYFLFEIREAFDGAKPKAEAKK